MGVLLVPVEVIFSRGVVEAGGEVALQSGPLVVMYLQVASQVRISLQLSTERA